MSTAEPPISQRPLDHTDATYYQVPRRRRRVLTAFSWVVGSLGALALAAGLFANQYGEYALSNPDNNSLDVKQAIQVLDAEPKDLPTQPVNVLVLGSDSRGEKSGSRSDTLMLVRLDFKRNFISILSFPRDLYVQIPGHGPDKINAAYSAGGTKLAIETVKALTGEKVPYFFNVDFEAFRRLVNDAGGVYLDVDRWYFNDNSGPGENFEQINVLPGYQKLRGSDALDYVRYRHTDSDFARITRQQLFLSELKRTSRSARGLDNIVDAIHAEVTTNLKSTNKLRQMLAFGLSTEKERIARVTVQGGVDTLAGGASIVRTSDQQIRDAVDKWKNPEFLNEAPQKAAAPSKLIVAVFNGSNRIGLAQTVGQALEAKGYKVSLGGNAPDDFYQSTSVFYAPNHRNDAKALAAQFGPNASFGERRKGMTTDADLVVMVGADYAGLVKPKPVTAAATKAKPEIMATLSLKQTIVNYRALTKSDALVPMHLPAGAQVVHVRVYNVERGERGTPNALTIVLRLPGLSSKIGGYRYATITQTSMKDPPIIATATGRDRKGGGYTYYNGKSMQRLLWRRGGMTYWITNSLDDALSDVTIRDIRQFMVRPARAKLPAGQKNTQITITTKGKTP